MAFPFAKPGDPDYVDSSSKVPAATQPQPTQARPAHSGPNRTENLHPRSVRPFSTTKLVGKTASATTLYKLAHLKVARTWGEFMFGNGLSTVGDPSQRGFATDMLAYSNPITGTLTGVNDMARNLYKGNYGQALGNLGMTALSWLPGGGLAGGALRAGAKSLGMAGARAATGAATNAAARGGARGLTNAMSAFGRRSGIQAVDDAARGIHNATRAGGQAVSNAQSAVTNTLQNFKIPGTSMRPLGPATNPAQGWKSWASPSAYKDWAVKNPAMAVGTTMHGYGTNPDGESVSDINNRLSGERDLAGDRLRELEQMGY